MFRNWKKWPLWLKGILGILISLIAALVLVAGFANFGVVGNVGFIISIFLATIIFFSLLGLMARTECPYWVKGGIIFLTFPALFFLLIYNRESWEGVEGMGIIFLLPIGYAFIELEAQRFYYFRYFPSGFISLHLVNFLFYFCLGAGVGSVYWLTKQMRWPLFLRLLTIPIVAIVVPWVLVDKYNYGLWGVVVYSMICIAISVLVGKIINQKKSEPPNSMNQFNSSSKRGVQSSIIISSVVLIALVVVGGGTYWLVNWLVNQKQTELNNEVTSLRTQDNQLKGTSGATSTSILTSGTSQNLKGWLLIYDPSATVSELHNKGFTDLFYIS